MAIEGKVRTLYTDKTQQEAIFPTTKVSAVTDDEGNGLNTLLEHIAYVDPTDMESAAVLANADTLGGYPASDYAFIEDLKNLKPEDIRAAPAGYGYGEATRLVWWDDADGTKLESYLDEMFTDISMKNKVYRYILVDYPVCIVSGQGGYADIVCTDMTGGIPQTITIVYYAPGGGGGMSIATKKKHSGVWYPWEYVNPPMRSGVEYRTTKRHNGQAVYTKLLNYSPQSFTAQTVLLPHEISNLRVGLLINVMWNKDGTQWRHFPSVYYGDTAWNGHAYWYGTENICFECGSTLRQFIENSGWNVRVLLEYTKEM